MMICLSPNGQDVVISDAPINDLLVATTDGLVHVQKEITGNGSWEVRRHALGGRHVSALLIEPRHGWILAGTHDSGLYLSKDRGETWEQQTHGLPITNIYSLKSVQDGDEVRLYAGTEPAHLFESVDSGESWHELQALRSVPGVDRWTFPAPPHLGHAKNISFDPRDSRRMFVSIEQGGLLLTEDGGEHFRELDAYYSDGDHVYKDVHRLVIHPANPDCLYFTGGEGLYRSLDGGDTWQHLTSRSMRIGYPDALHIAPYPPYPMFMAGAINSPNNWRQKLSAEACIARSRDGGESWEVLEKGLPVPMRGNIEAMSLNAWQRECALFAGTTNGDVFFSDNEGDSWTPIVQGLAPVSKAGHWRNLRSPEEQRQAAIAG